MPLSQFEVHYTAVSDLKPLAESPLETLSVFGTQVSDLSPLEKCNSLAKLAASRTKVTHAQVAALQKALPNCKIEWDDPAKDTKQPDSTSKK